MKIVPSFSSVDITVKAAFACHSGVFFLAAQGQNDLDLRMANSEGSRLATTFAKSSLLQMHWRVLGVCPSPSSASQTLTIPSQGWEQEPELVVTDDLRRALLCDTLSLVSSIRGEMLAMQVSVECLCPCGAAKLMRRHLNVRD